MTIPPVLQLYHCTFCGARFGLATGNVSEGSVWGAVTVECHHCGARHEFLVGFGYASATVFGASIVRRYEWSRPLSRPDGP